MEKTTTVHTPVLLAEVIEGLRPEKGNIIIDATLGGGGHAAALCSAAHITLVALDADQVALDRGMTALKQSGSDCAVHMVHSNFRSLDTALDSLEIDRIDAALFDLGMSSDQLEQSGRGFSFQKDEPLLMTFKEAPAPSDTTAEVIVNEWGEENIADILYGFGDEQFSRRIARNIVKARQQKRITRTVELVEIIEESVPWWYRKRKSHPATRSFQALRMAVNDELGAITEGIESAFRRLKPEGRIAVITFHSIEDRHIKHLFKDIAERGGTLITKKPITASDEEIAQNPRARSAKLRIIQKI